MIWKILSEAAADSGILVFNPTIPVEIMKLPDCQFYLFGMGRRRKLLYKHGALLDALTGKIVRKWDAASESIYPAEYSVELTVPDGKKVVIREDEKGRD